jgi:hypothetical protein
MIRSLLAALTMTLAMGEVFVCCGGEIQNDVDAEAGFDVAAHWGECCYRYKGPAPTCRGPDGGEIALADEPMQCPPFQYCGVKRDWCGPNGCANGHDLDPIPFQCCGDLQRGAGGVPIPDAADNGIDPDCLPYGLDDGSGLPAIDGAP